MQSKKETQPGEKETQPLTEQETKLAQLKTLGLSHKEIGAQLGRSEHAVSVSLARIYRKFGASGGCDFIRKYLWTVERGCSKSA